MLNHICNAIGNIFVTRKQNLNKRIIECYDNTKKVIENQLKNEKIYLVAMQKGIKANLIELSNSKNPHYFDTMLENASNDDINGKKDLKRFQQIFADIPDCSFKIAEMFKSYITRKGLDFIQESKGQKESNNFGLIKSLIKLYNTFSNLTENEMEGKQIYNNALAEALRIIMNKEYETHALLARFNNHILKKGSNIDVSNLTNTMDDIINLYECIDEKAVFERDYEQYFASRILQDLSENMEWETLMINKFRKKTISETFWQLRLVQMIEDIEESKKLMIDFQSKVKNCMIKLNVSCCHQLSWEYLNGTSVRIDADIFNSMQTFKKYYCNKFVGRALRFDMTKGKANVSVQFNAKCKKILIVSTFQMMILLLFNTKKTLTFKQMLDRTNIPRQDLIVAILSMAHPKVKVCRKAPNTKDIENDHKFQINPKYTSSRALIPIPTLNVKIDKLGDNNQMDAIFRLRRHQLDAAIVRIMKVKKSMKHQDLAAEIAKQLIARFKPRDADIKKRINFLVDLAYLERDENDLELYHYNQ